MKETRVLMMNVRDKKREIQQVDIAAVHAGRTLGAPQRASARALLPPATTEDAAQDGDQSPLIAIISTANTGDPSLPDRARARQTCLAAICAYIRPAKSNMAHCRPLR